MTPTVEAVLHLGVTCPDTTNGGWNPEASSA